MIEKSFEELKKENEFLRKKPDNQSKNNQFNTFFENNTAVMLEIDTNTKQITNANKAAVKFYGYKKNILLQKTIRDLNPLPDDKIDKLMKKALKQSSSFFEFDHQSENGTIRKVGVYASPYHTDDKSLIYITVIDITERKEAEKKLKKQNKELIAAREAAEESKAKLKDLANLLPQVIYECNMDGKLTFVNEHALELFKYTKEEFKNGINILETLAPESREKANIDFQTIIKGKDPEDPEFTALKKDGTTFPVHIYSSAIIKDNKPKGLRGVIIDISALKKAENEIKSKNKKLNIITEIEKIGTFDRDIKTDLMTWNDEMFKIHGILKQVSIPYENWIKYLHPEDFEKTTAILSASVQTKEPKYADFRIVRPTGEIRYVRASASVITDKNNKVTNSIGVIADITEQKKTQEKIKDQLRQIELINANLPNIIWKTNIDNKGNFINSYISDVIDSFLELPVGTINNDWNKYFEFVKPEYIDTLLNEIKKGFENPGLEITTDYEVTKLNGETAWFSSRGRVIEENNTLTGYGTTIDITERINTEQEILKAKEKAEENEEKFKSIFDLSPQPVSISNLSGKLIEVNKKFCEVSGYSKEELLNQNVIELGLYSEEVRAQFLEKIKNDGFLKNMEIRFFGKTNKEIDTLTNATVIKLNGIPHILTMVTDISKRKKFETEIIKAKEKAEESDRLKTEFINNLSHEIRTPMNGILGFSQLLNNEDTSVKKQKNYIKIIQNSGHQLMRIIDDILEISKLETKQVKTVDDKVCLNNLLLELFSIFDIKAKENKTPLYLKKELSDSASTIYTDSSKLSKILSNLLENAIKFTNKGSIEFGYYTENNNMVIFVKDTGIGIKKEKQEVIFERFSQEEKGISEHPGGLGLGLSIAKENAELLGGKITLESEKGKGSVFYITIPYKPVNSDKTKNGKLKGQNRMHRKTILIVEDEEVNYIYIETLLEYFNKDIIKLHAKNGKEAVELCKKRDDINFVLMDLKMPIMDGYEATRLIKKIRPNLPIIAQTAYSTSEEKEKAILAGCDDFISKPISKEIFSKIINKYKYF